MTKSGGRPRAAIDWARVAELRAESTPRPWAAIARVLGVSRQALMRGPYPCPKPQAGHRQSEPQEAK